MSIIDKVGIDKILSPMGLSVEIDVALLTAKDPSVASLLSTSAMEYHKAEQQIREIMQDHFKTKLRYHVRPYNLIKTVAISELSRQGYERQIVQFSAIVTSVQSVKKLMSHKEYKCVYNNGSKYYDGDTVDDMLDMPKSRTQMFYCKACGQRMPHKMNKDSCVFVPVQRFVIQETLEEIAGGKPAAKIMGYALDDLACDKVNPGEKVIVVGIVWPDIKEGKTHSVYLEILSITKLKTSHEEVHLTLDDITAISDIAKRPNVYDQLTESYCSTIYGYKNEKLALLCALFGSPRVMVEGQEKRGDIHVLLAGDPGISKSVMIKYAAGVSPRGVIASGMRATGAGLTASWVRAQDAMSELQPGAMVIADGGGIVCIDEIDKVDKAQIQSIHDPMESGVISVAMAGNIQQFNARCSIVAAANPKSGRYNPERTLTENIGLDPALLSRFDLIFVMRDLPVLETEDKLAEHILQTHSNKIRKVPVEHAMLRKYIAYARRIDPELGEQSEAYRLIKKGYLEVRLERGRDKIPATPRQLEALSRISKALARMTLSSTVEKRHAEKAIELFNASTKITSLGSEMAEPKGSEHEQKIRSWILEEANLNNGLIFKRKIRGRCIGKENIMDKVVKEMGLIEEDEGHWKLP